MPSSARSSIRATASARPWRISSSGAASPSPGRGVLSHIFEGYEPWFGDIRARERGSLVADRTGPATTYAMINLQDRSTMMVDVPLSQRGSQETLKRSSS